MIEDIMRNDVLHTVGLDWLDARQFKAAAGKAALLLTNDRANYEAFYEQRMRVLDSVWKG